jgi:hypothetical protein
VNRKIVYDARREGREQAYRLLPGLKDSGVEQIDVGEWRFIRPTGWLSKVLLEEDSLSYTELKEVDQHYLAAMNTILTPVGWKAIIIGKWNDGHLMVTRVKGKA